MGEEWKSRKWRVTSFGFHRRHPRRRKIRSCFESAKRMLKVYFKLTNVFHHKDHNSGKRWEVE